MIRIQSRMGRMGGLVAAASLAASIASFASTITQAGGDDMTDTGAKASASASAQATASGGAKSGGRTDECRAQASSYAKAVSGDERQTDSDEDGETAHGENCSASARSSASATVEGDAGSAN